MEIDIAAKRLDVRAHETKPRVVDVREVGFQPGPEIVDADEELDISPPQQFIAQIRAQESAAAGDENSLSYRVQAVGFLRSAVIRWNINSVL